MDGVFIINKDKGCTSHDIVAKMRKILNTKKVGHTGTLDPMATGVLPILVGKATKIEKYLVEHDKTYIAELQFGEKRDTADSEGICIESQEVDNSILDESKIKHILNEMVGIQEQIPPMYSAIKVDGRKLYEYAREGKKIELQPRKIEIYSIELIDVDANKKIIEFCVSCSKGTYIRTLCEDIAKKLGTIGFMKSLKRTAVGDFKIENSYTIEQIEKQNAKFYEEKIISIEAIFRKNDKIVLDNNRLKHFLNGVKITENVNNGLYRIYNLKGEFIGIGIIKDNLLKRDIIIKE